MAKFTFHQVNPWLCALEEKEMGVWLAPLSFCQNLIAHNSDLLKANQVLTLYFVCLYFLKNTYPQPASKQTFRMFSKRQEYTTG